MTEEILIEKCKAGQPSAQKVLYERYAERMFRVCYRYVKNELDAEDILINGFVKIYKNIARFEYRGKGSLDGWIKRIIVNESLMFLRKKTYLHLSTEDVPNLESHDTPDMNINAEEIYALVMELPTGYRTVFNLYAIEGYSHKEIAEQLGVTESTSKSQLSKARAALKRMLIEKDLLV